MKKKVAIIGSGFSGLSAAAYCAKTGNEVHILKKTAVWEDVQEISKHIMAIALIWAQAGIGCRILLKIFSKTLEKLQKIL
jgi:thioredoxin reductase